MLCFAFLLHCTIRISWKLRCCQALAVWWEASSTILHLRASPLSKPKRMSTNNQPVTLKQVSTTVDGNLTGNEQAEITDVTHHSRQAKSGSLFAAVRGE